jgi:hypothetical protein
MGCGKAARANEVIITVVAVTMVLAVAVGAIFFGSELHRKVVGERSFASCRRAIPHSDL